MKNFVDTDVLIIGAGPAGIGAAVAAASCGARVCLLEKLSYPGGRATASAVGTICGTFFRGKELKYAMKGFPKQFSERIISKSNKEPICFSEDLWFLPCQPEYFRETASSILEENNIQTFFNATLLALEVVNHKISKALFRQNQIEYVVTAKSIIDCSGVGTTFEFIQHEKITAENHQASAIVFSVSSVSVENEFTLRHILIKHFSKNIQSGNIPEHFQLISIVPGSMQKDSVLLKVSLPWDPMDDLETTKSKAEILVHDIFSFLKTNIPAFENSNINWIADEPGQRTGHRPVCRDVLTEEHVISCAKTNDSICNAAWPIEYWEVGNNKVDMTFFNKNDFYSIPAGCLISKECRNLFFAGKLISATERAIASARVMGICLATGYSAGVLASFYAYDKPESEAIKLIHSQMLDLG